MCPACKGLFQVDQDNAINNEPENRATDTTSAVGAQELHRAEDRHLSQPQGEVKGENLPGSARGMRFIHGRWVGVALLLALGTLSGILLTESVRALYPVTAIPVQRKNDDWIVHIPDLDFTEMTFVADFDKQVKIRQLLRDDQQARRALWYALAVASVDMHEAKKSYHSGDVLAPKVAYVMTMPPLINDFKEVYEVGGNSGFTVSNGGNGAITHCKWRVIVAFGEKGLPKISDCGLEFGQY